MEMLRKRRASTEVQELMNAVKSDYEFFARFDSPEDLPSQSSPPPKRQRCQSDNVLVQYAVVKPKPRYLTQGYQPSKPLNEKYNSSRFDEYNSIPELIHVTPEDQRRGRPREQSQKSREQEVSSRDKHEQARERLAYSRDQSEKSRKEEIFQRETPDFWASHGKEKFIIGSPYASKTTRCESNSNHVSSPQITNPGEFICLSSEPFISRGADAIVGRERRMVQKTKHLPPVIEAPDEPPLLIRFDTNTTRGVSENEAKSHRVSQSTKINFGSFPMNERLTYDATAKIRRASFEEEQEIVKRPINVEKRASPATKMPNSDSEDELIIVDPTLSPASSQFSDSRSPANTKAQDNHVTSPQTNKKPEETKDVLPIERKSPGCGSPVNLIPTDKIWPDYVITRVGSLLWLDKEVVYPVTLDEMRRRIQDPENFTFQMLIAYVRHSRAKGRQFLDYWKCQPSGKTSRPNVLSKLCEADAKELVKGIQNVNEEYFPQEALAKNVAANIFQENGNRLTANENEGKEAKELAVQEKVKAIEKSRWDTSH